MCFKQIKKKKSSSRNICQETTWQLSDLLPYIYFDMLDGFYKILFLITFGQPWSTVSIKSMV